MFTSLYSKLAMVLLGLFFLVGITFVLVSLYSTDMYQQEVNQKLNSEIARLIVGEKLVLKDKSINQEALAEIFHMLMVINPSIEVYLLDPEGKILAFSAEPGKVKRRSVELGPVKEFLGGDAMFPLLGDDPRSMEKKKVFTAARIPETGKLEGYLYIILGGEIYDNIIGKLQTSHIFRLTVWVIIASIVVAVLAGLLIFASLTRRLRRLAVAVDAYKGGTSIDRPDLPSDGDGRSGDEIDKLVSTFRSMAQRIEEQVESIKKADILRRELVAGVSHDLRTPLATLQGYMETLLMKNKDLAEEERLNYLDTAVKQCNRLSKLVSDLFELAKLEARDISVHREPFNLRELVQDIVQKFKLMAKDKHVGIIINASKELPYVNADIALIERVLENLLDNALRFSPPDGTVSVVLNRDNSDVTVEVIDTGPGIPENEISRIFDRFYQLGDGKKGKSDHSGLGLAITKRILELHGASIDVRSELNSGTTFMFKLPIRDSR